MKHLLTQHELDLVVQTNLARPGIQNALVGQRVALLWMARFSVDQGGPAGVDATIVEVHGINGENGIFTLAVDSSYVGLYSVLEKIELYPIQKVDEHNQPAGWTLCFPDEKYDIPAALSEDLEPFEPDPSTPTVH